MLLRTSYHFAVLELPFEAVTSFSFKLTLSCFCHGTFDIRGFWPASFLHLATHFHWTFRAQHLQTNSALLRPVNHKLSPGHDRREVCNLPNSYSNFFKLCEDMDYSSTRGAAGSMFVPHCSSTTYDRKSVKLSAILQWNYLLRATNTNFLSMTTHNLNAIITSHFLETCSSL